MSRSSPTPPAARKRPRSRRNSSAWRGECADIPCIIGGERIITGRTEDVTMPHAHGHVLARVHQAGAAEIERAVASCADAAREWQAMRWEQRAAVLLRAAELLAGKYRQTLNAATMLGQSKTCHQAEIDSACELIDFWRFNVAYMQQDLYEEQPALGHRASGITVELPCSRGLCLRGHPIQLHRHRRQPADCSRT